MTLGMEDEDGKEKIIKTAIYLTPNVHYMTCVHDLMSSYKVNETQTSQFHKRGKWYTEGLNCTKPQS